MRQGALLALGETYVLHGLEYQSNIGLGLKIEPGL